MLNTVKSIQSIERFKCEPTNKKLNQYGAWYIGQINGTQRSGWGKFKWSNGGTYEGYYVENKRHGKGKYVWNDETVYIGMFENDLRHGYGELTWLNKESYHGEFFKDMREGFGIYKWPDGRRYEGNFKNNVKCGFGIFTMNNGDTFEGFYKNDQRYGPGIFTNKKTMKQDVGIWQSLMIVKLCTAVPEAFMYEHVTEHRINAGDNISEKIKSANLRRSISGDTHFFTHTKFAESSNMPSSFPLHQILKGVRGVHSKPGYLEESSLMLLQAASIGDVRTTLRILEEGLVSVNVCDSTGHSSVLAAAVNCHVEILNCLLDYGANINILTNEGLSVLSACHVLLYTELNFIQNIAENMDYKDNLFISTELEKKTGIVINRNDKMMIMGKYEQLHKALVPSKRKKSLTPKKIRQHSFSKFSTKSSTTKSESISDEGDLVDCSFDQWKLEFYQRSLNRVKKVEVINCTFKEVMLNPHLLSLGSEKPDILLNDCVLKDVNTGPINILEDPLPTTRASLYRCSNDSKSLEGSISTNDMKTNFINNERKPHLEKTVQLLLKRGANPNASSLPLPVIFFPVKSANTAAVLALLERGADTAARTNQKKLCPLHIAVALPCPEGVEIAKHLLSFGADPNLQDDYFGNINDGGRTPLHIVCCREDNYKQSLKIGKLLLEHGADPDLLCAGNSALSLAIASGNDLLVDMLLNYNANPSLKLTHGLGSILSVAVSFQAERHRTPNERMKLVEKLINAGADLLTPVRISDKYPPGTVVDYAYHVFSQDRRIACTPYHALSSLERECFNARRSLLTYVGKHLRNAALKKEETEPVEDQEDMYSVWSQRDERFSSIASPQGRDESCGLRFVIVKTAGKNNLKKRLRYCHECGRSIGVRLTPCARCREVFYCSKNCKAKAWNARHREECARLIGQKTSPEARADSPTPTTNGCIIDVKHLQRTASIKTGTTTPNGFLPRL
ncbi:ankyrin repeat and MYND domain-containing protein 1-like [Hydractinia symbiolongicarpus]|uniref:ankyrin repeat and MYND domain-containing protein 1-like n=1 Tax=Hydractinia symbiolongicarpus TaxID=13093 RepID=UPI00254B8DA8|nr:ankyrin repeat and MYND domain-containing protein 1-like [Hydractinia symbiolongicarpus]